MDNSRSVFIVFCDELDVWEDNLFALEDKPFLVVMIKKDDDPDDECKKVREKIRAEGIYTDILSWHGEAPDFNDDIFGNFIERRIRKDIERKGRKCPDMRVVLWARRKSYFSLVKMIFKNRYDQVSYSRNILEGAINREGNSSESGMPEDDGAVGRSASNEKETKTGKKNTRDFFGEKRGDTSNKHEDPYAQYIGNAFSNISSVGQNLFETKNISEVEACTIKRGASTSSVANIAAGFFGMGSPFKNREKKKNEKPEERKEEHIFSDSEPDMDDVLSEQDSDMDIESAVPSDGPNTEDAYSADEYDKSEYLDSDCYEEDPEGLYDFPYSDEEDLPYVDTYMSEDIHDSSGEDDLGDMYHTFSKQKDDTSSIRGGHNYSGKDGFSKTTYKKNDDKYSMGDRDHGYRDPDPVENEGDQDFGTESGRDRDSFNSIDDYFQSSEEGDDVEEYEMEGVDRPEGTAFYEDEPREEEPYGEGASKGSAESKKKKGNKKPERKPFSEKLKTVFGSQKSKKQVTGAEDPDAEDDDSDSGCLDGIYHSKNYKSVKNTENGVYVDSLDDAKAALSYFLIENFIITVGILKKGVVLDHDEAFEMIMLMLKTSDREVFNKSWTMMSDVTVRFSDKENNEYNILRERAIYYYSVSSVLYYPRQGQMIKDLKKHKGD